MQEQKVYGYARVSSIDQNEARQIQAFEDYGITKEWHNEISAICHQTKSPVYITKNGAGDLAVMSIELYELLVDRYELYKEIEKGIESLDKGEKYSSEEVYDELDKI
ncbi:MAG: type II toxin-antitoxin system prevent-host-death family antitoxin [Bacilli bacterium]|nr:type II toxin-antitoxin system prevent-host-death family antitoxin [Bacilli bacterium]